jgi:hypothetical protein
MITSKQISFRFFDDDVFIISFLLISGRLLLLYLEKCKKLQKVSRYSMAMNELSSHNT